MACPLNLHTVYPSVYPCIDINVNYNVSGSFILAHFPQLNRITVKLLHKYITNGNITHVYNQLEIRIAKLLIKTK